MGNQEWIIQRHMQYWK